MNDLWNLVDGELARIRARPTAGPFEPAPTGLRGIPLTNGREGLLSVPDTYQSGRPIPLVVALHGAGSRPQRALDRIQPPQEEFEAIFFAPQSQAPTWDIRVAGYGPDIYAIDAALGEIFSRYAVDPEYVALAGFSDGASYALSVGMNNGDLFKQLIAFSPGFVIPSGRHGEPRMFISHGTLDAMLNINISSRMLVPLLRAVGCNVHYLEFDGPHDIPPEIRRAAYMWLGGADEPAPPNSA